MRLAFAGGTILPILELTRRWSQLTDPAYFMLWFDDIIIAAFLLFSAFKVNQSPKNGQRFLIGAWGYAVGQMVASLVSQIMLIHEPDPAPVSSIAMAWIKAAILCYCFAGLVLSIKKLVPH